MDYDPNGFDGFKPGNIYSQASSADDSNTPTEQYRTMKSKMNDEDLDNQFSADSGFTPDAPF
jgi:hypothetical protein